MSIKEKVKQVKASFDQFKQLSFDSLYSDPPPLGEWEGIDFTEFKASIEFIKDIVGQALERDVPLRLTFSGVNGLHSSLQNSNVYCQQFIGGRDQSSFQNAANHVDALAYHLSVYGITDEVRGGFQLDTAQKLYNAESAKLVDANNQASVLVANVKSLIEPAVAGSLSKSFSDRKKNLFWTRVVWGLGSIALGVWGMYETKSFVAVIQEASKLPIESFWQTVMMRAIILVPIYIGFGFVLSQYKKERDFEEEYAHKAAISSSLPNYRDLAKDDVVKDEIASAAAKVIFAPPVRDKSSKGEKLEPIINSVRQLVDSVGKTVGK